MVVEKRGRLQKSRREFLEKWGEGGPHVKSDKNKKRLNLQGDMVQGGYRRGCDRI